MIEGVYVKRKLIFLKNKLNFEIENKVKTNKKF